MRTRTTETSLISKVEFQKYTGGVESIYFYKVVEMENGVYYRTYYSRQDERNFTSKRFSSYDTLAKVKSAIAYAKRQAAKTI